MYVFWKIEAFQMTTFTLTLSHIFTKMHTHQATIILNENLNSTQSISLLHID